MNLDLTSLKTIKEILLKYNAQLSKRMGQNFLISRSVLEKIIKSADLKSVRNVCSVGEALNKSVYDFYKKLGIDINDTYWQTETGAIVIAVWSESSFSKKMKLPPLKKKPGTLGRAIPGINASIKDNTISLKPDFPSLMTGIYRHEKMYKDSRKVELRKRSP